MKHVSAEREVQVKQHLEIMEIVRDAQKQAYQAGYEAGLAENTQATATAVATKKGSLSAKDTA